MNAYQIGIFIVIALSLFVVFVGILPQKESLDGLEIIIAQKQVELETEENYVKKMEENLEKVEEKGALLEKIDLAIPSSPLLPEVLNFFQKTAAQSGLALKELYPTFSDFSRGEKIKNLRIDLALEGTYEDFKKLLSVIENSARLIEIEGIIFSTPEIESKKEAGIFEFEVATKVYFY